MFIETKEDHFIWTEKWRPTTLSEYVGNESVIDTFGKYMAEGDVPNILLYSKSPGSGKTTAAKMLATNIDADILYINASDERNLDTVRDKIKGFVSTVGFRKIKVAILDECDAMTPVAQSALRNMMETYSKTSRFILTCNYVEKLIEPLVSRCQVFELQPPSKTEVAKRIVTILNGENVKFTIPDVSKFVSNGYPDMRRIINDCQQNTIAGELKLPTTLNTKFEYLEKILEILKTEKVVKTAYSKIRQVIADAKVSAFDEMYTYLYTNVDEYATGHIAAVIIIIAEAQYQSIMVSDREIPAAACFAKILMQLHL